MSINEVRYLPECGSTNAYVKEHFEEFGPVGAVYTTNQTAGRGRLGRTWVNAEGKALYYTVAIREPLASSRAGAFCAALASTWPSPRAILTPPTCPTAPRWRCRGQMSI